ncbi:MAG: DUF4838 domain-containing protein [Kiritimatiellae bacterium]|nr:DUF4838 domain-containing protein [Kiritimatiellia bacterium]
MLSTCAGVLMLHAGAEELRPLLPPGDLPVAIRLPSAPIPAERRAAAELVAALSSLTGRAARILEHDDDSLGTVELRHDPALGPEEYRLSWAPAGNALRIDGGRPRGILYGAIGLLHELGCRWYTREVARIPPNPAPMLPSGLNRHGRPAFEYREVYWTEALDPDWAMRNRLNSSGAPLRDEHGGRVVWGRFVHTFAQILNPAEHFDAHPEWFSMVNGRRLRDHTQLCLANPDVRRIAVETVRRWIRERPDATIFSVSQNDWLNPCQCPECAALDTAEGSPAASLLQFVNHIADAIAQDHPTVWLETLAYQYSRRPPRTIRPRPNVIVRLCSIECCFSHPLDGCSEPSNVSFMEDLRGWQRVAPRLYIWDYTTDFAHYLLPFPNLDVLAPNVRTFATHGVRGVFEQGNYSPGGGGELAELRSWLLAQLLWDPNQDMESLLREFVNGVYGAAATEVAAYLESRRRIARDSGEHVRIFDGPDRADLHPDALLEWDTTLERAERAATNDPALTLRIERLRMPVWYALVLSMASADRRAEAARRLAQAARRQRVTHLHEQTRDIRSELERIEFEASRRVVAPPPGVLRGEDHLIQVAFLDRYAQRLHDPAADDHIAVRAVGETREWLFQWRPRAAVTGQTYRARARVRIEGGGTPTNAALSFGVYDPSARRVLANRVWRANELGTETYGEIELAPVSWSGGAYLWLAPSGDTNAVRAVWLDRFDLVAGPSQ